MMFNFKNNKKYNKYNVIDSILSALKLILILLILTIFILKLLGFNFISDIIFNPNNFNLFSFVICSLLVSYYILNLYLMLKFSTKKVQIPEVLPDLILSSIA